MSEDNQQLKPSTVRPEPVKKETSYPTKFDPTPSLPQIGTPTPKPETQQPPALPHNSTIVAMEVNNSPDKKNSGVLDFNYLTVIDYVNDQKHRFESSRDKASVESNETERSLSMQLILLTTVSNND